MKIFILCPLADQQKPINEYIQLKEKEIINWTMLSEKNYIIYISRLYLNLFGLLFFILFFVTISYVGNRFYLWNSIIGSSFYRETKLWEIFLTIQKESVVVLLTMFAIVFFIWWEVSKNLKKSHVLYEEGSWYEVQRWEKPMFLIKNDRLLSKKHLTIIKRRIIYTLTILGFIQSIYLFV